MGPASSAACRRSSSRLAERGCHVLMSNSASEEIAALYERNADARSAGLRVRRVRAARDHPICVAARRD
jgi:hypothetical protein